MKNLWEKLCVALPILWGFLLVTAITVLSIGTIAWVLEWAINGIIMLVG
jgi:hypothetical protein